MELLDRYLREVALWLPRKQSADIVAEISADLRAEVEEQAQALGRPLSAGEEEAILTRWGRPMLVASRYQPQESLIGPALLPTYYFVLKVLALVHVLPWFLVWVGLAVFDPSWRAGHPDLVASLRPLGFNALALFALVTGIFAAAERRHRHQTLEIWTARELTSPRSPDWQEISRVGSVVEIVIGLAAIAWWSGLAGSPSSFVIDDALRVTWTPLQSGFFWTLLALMVAAAGVSTANLLRPRWTVSRLALQTALDATGVLVVCLLLPIALVQVLPGGGADLDRVAMLAWWINLSWRVSLAVAGVILAARSVLGVLRLGRVNRRTPTVAPANP